MSVYEWEQATTQSLSQMPRSGAFFELMRFLSHPGVYGIVFWLFFFLFVYRSRLRAGVTTLLLAGVAAGIGDLVSRRIIKAYIARSRPEYLNDFCSGSHCWGFVSSHATNITAFATVFCLQDRRNLFWAVPLVSLVSISRLYLLDHYPLDILGGIVIGAALGTAVTWTFRRFLKWKLDQHNTRGEIN